MTGVASRDKLKHDERSDQLFSERMMLVVEKQWMKSEYLEHVEQR